jgi:hypothetical protein
MRTAAIFCLLVFSFLASCSEPKTYHYEATGYVVDETGAPLPEVLVILRGIDLARVRFIEAKTDTNGHFYMNFDIDPFEWRQEAHWVFQLHREGYHDRNVAYPMFTYDDRFRQQGYWFEVHFRDKAIMKQIPTPTGTPAEATTPAIPTVPAQ